MTPYSTIDQPEVIAMLFPPQSKDLSPCPAHAEDVSLEISSEIAIQCRFYFASEEAPVFLLYPATGVSAHQYDLIAENYLKQSINVFLVSYRGCGINGGSPSIAAMYTDAEKMYGLAVAWLAKRGCTGPLFVMGQSLGSICAIDIVSKHGDTVKGLIIESGICGTASFLEAKGVSLEKADILEEEGFNNIEKIEKIKTPTLIFHGAKDRLVAVAEAEKLQASSGARTKQFFVIPGAERHTLGETGGELYYKTIKQFTDTVCGVNTWRQKRRSHKRTQEG